MSELLRTIDISSLINFSNYDKSTIKDNERVIIEVKKEHVDDPKEKKEHNISYFLKEDNIERTTNELIFFLKYKGYIFDTDVLQNNKYNEEFDSENKEEINSKNLYSKRIKNNIFIPVDVEHKNTMFNYIEDNLSKKIDENEVLIEEKIKFNNHQLFPNNYFSIKLDVHFDIIDIYDLCWLNFKEELINSGDVKIDGWRELGQLYKDNIKRFEVNQIFQAMRNDEDIKLDNFLKSHEEAIKRLL